MNTMCQRVQRELATLVETRHGIDPPLEQHLDRCDGCALTLERARRAADSLARLGDGFVLPADLLERTMARLPPPRRWIAGHGRWVAPAALAVGMLLAVAIHGPTTRPSPASVRGQLTAGGLEQRNDGGWSKVAVGGRVDLGRPVRTTARATMQLPQGVQLRLDRGAALGALGSALDLRRGRMLVDVRPRDSHRPPVVVHVPGGRVEVLGTRFHLAAHPTLTLVNVIHGRVRAVTAAGSVVVSTGQEGALATNARPTVAMAPDMGRTLAWTEPEGPSAEPAPPGLGLLTANRPGHPDEKRPLTLQQHEVQVRVQGGLARTEITETFHNATGHTLEGMYRFPLPSGARVCRLALYVDGRLEEATVVERDRATRIWRGVIRNATPRQLRKQEEYVWVPGPWRDPALLQWREGNQFELRIFPIPPRSDRKVILAYTETLPRTPRGHRYVYPLPRGVGQTRAGHFSFNMDLAGHDPAAPLHVTGYALQTRPVGDEHRLTFDASPFEPAGDLVVDFATEAPTSVLQVHSYLPPGELSAYVQLSLTPPLPAPEARQPSDVVLVVDRSHSTTGEAGRRSLMLVQALVSQMDGRERVALLACDSACHQLGRWDTPSGDTAQRMVRALGAVHPGGATDLGRAMQQAARLLANRPAPGARRTRAIYIGDGIPTVGELEPGRLAALVRRELGRSTRLTTVGVGTSADATVLEAMARAGGGSHLAYGPGTTVLGQALQVLARQDGPALERLKVTLPDGLEQVTPRRLPVLYPGQRLVLVARASGLVQGQVVLDGQIAGQPYHATFPLSIRSRQSEGNAFLPRLWAQLTVEDLLADEHTDHRARIVELSKQHYLLTRYTSLLVLESEAMRRAFGVSQGERAAQWSGREAEEVEPDGSEQEHPAPGPGLGSRGAGTIGSGRGYGRGGTSADHVRDHSPGTVVPQRQAASVMGSLDRNIIARVIRRHLSEVRGVYSRQLRNNPDLAGRLAVTFTIGSTGQVTQVSVRGSTLNDAQIERDLVQVIRRWRFPAPAGGGNIVVTYPFVFQTAGGSTPPAEAQDPLHALIPPTPRVLGPSRSWIRMRRVYYQESELSTLSHATAGDLQLIAQRQSELQQQPDSRDRHRHLIRVLSRAGQVGPALRALESWLDHEPDSVEALTLLAETAARQGQRARAMRALGSLVELDPRHRRLHRRLSAMHRALGDTQSACAHFLALSAIAPADHPITRLANDCREGLGPGPVASRAAHGSVVLDGAWSGDADLDLALVTRTGRRIAWLGTSRAPTFDHVASARGERVALRWLPAGRYRVELCRGTVSDAPERGTVQGRVLLHAPGLRRRLTFRLDPQQQRIYLAELVIHRRSRLEPADPVR